MVKVIFIACLLFTTNVVVDCCEINTIYFYQVHCSAILQNEVKQFVKIPSAKLPSQMRYYLRPTRVGDCILRVIEITHKPRDDVPW